MSLFVFEAARHAVGRFASPAKERIQLLLKPVADRVKDKINGKRGGILATFSFLFFMVALSYLKRPDDRTRLVTFRWLPEWFPFYLFGIFWALAAVVALVNAFRYKARPARSDKAGFQALSGVLIAWAGMYVLMWILGYTATGWYSAALFGTFATIVLICASWTNPTKEIDLSALLGKHAEEKST